jgi:MFS family permease
VRPGGTADATSGDTEPRTPFWGGGFGWFLLLYFLLNIGMGMFPPLLPQVMTGLELSFAQAGLLGTAFALTRFAMDLPVGLLAERVGFARILHAGMGLFVLGGAVAAWAPSFGAMLVARGLTGLASGAGNIVSILYLMRTGAACQRNRRANLYELSVIAGMAVSSDLAGMVAGHWGWRSSFWTGTLVLAVAWIVAAPPLCRVLSAVQGAMVEGGPSPRLGTCAMPQRGALLAIYLAMFAQAFAWGGGISTLLPLYGGHALDLSPQALGRTMALAFWAEVCLLFPVGWAADTWGKVRILVPGFVAVLIGVVSAPASAGVVAYGAAFALLTSGMSVWMLVPGLLTEQLGGMRGRAAGLYRLVTDLGFILAPAIAGWLIGRHGFTLASVAIGGVVALSLLATLRFLAPEGRH